MNAPSSKIFRKQPAEDSSGMLIEGILHCVENYTTLLGSLLILKFFVSFKFLLGGGKQKNNETLCLVLPNNREAQEN